MYVGSSTTGLYKRIKQHIEKCPDKTYALRLNDWFNEENDKYSITIKEYNVEREVLQIIEDALSCHLKPAFGKTGGNNK